jgi:hypothetical protein
MSEKQGVPEEFKKVMKDFVSDIRSTFPEYEPLIKKWYKEPSAFESIENDQERSIAIEKSENEMMDYLFNFCQKKYPPRFFEILYENADIFKEDSELDTEFLPNVSFKNIWHFDISEKTRATIWKYLQLILFSIVGTLGNKEAFGDSAKLFEAINEDEFKSKLEDTLSQMQNLFNMSDMSGSNMSEEDVKNSFGVGDMPDVNELHNHISGMLDGKLGQLAKEIAEETAQHLNIDVENNSDMKDVFNKLIKNPTKLMGLVKNIGNKLDEKLKSGEIKESEIMEEASEMMKKMKNMPGMGNIQSMLSKMGMGGMGGMGKVNMGAMESQLNRNMKAAKTKERMRAKAEASKATKDAVNNLAQTQSQTVPQLTEEQIISVFTTGETVEKTPRGAKPPIQNSNKKIKNKAKK